MRARAALHAVDLRDPLLVPQVIELLGRDETARAAAGAEGNIGSVEVQAGRRGTQQFGITT
jgi:hypothetical protein